jgi:hypothetical protein
LGRRLAKLQKLAATPQDQIHFQSLMMEAMPRVMPGLALVPGSELEQRTVPAQGLAQALSPPAGPQSVREADWVAVVLAGFALEWRD